MPDNQSPQPLSIERLPALSKNLNRIQDHLKQMIAQVAGIHGLQRSDYEVLSALYDNGTPRSLNPKHLSEHLIFSSGGLTKVLNRLDDSGLIQRQATGKDKRGKPVQLTALGVHVTQTLFKQLLELEQQAFKPLSQKQHDQLDKLLTKLLTHWDEK